VTVEEPRRLRIQEVILKQKDLVKLAQCLHTLEPKIGGNWHEVVEYIGLAFLDEFPANFDIEDFKTIAAGADPEEV